MPVTDDEGGDDDSSEGDETEAGSETEETNNHQVEVVDYSKPDPSFSTLTPQTALMTKREMRAYLSSRPPEDAVSASAKQARVKQPHGDGNDDPQNEDSRSLLANDLELQRLISESHILSATNPFNNTASSSFSSSGAAPSKAFSEGRTRALTTDLRLQKLGSTGSIFNQQKKMPMAMRKGILGAKAAREEKRRREAKENGIILERERPDEGGSAGKKAKRKQGKRSDLPVDMPGMGRMKGGELRLSKRDVRAVEMEGKRMGDSRGKGKHRRRR